MTLIIKFSVKKRKNFELELKTCEKSNRSFCVKFYSKAFFFTSQIGQDKRFWWNLTKSAGFQPNLGPGNIRAQGWQAKY